VDYLLSKYSLTPINDSKAKQVVSLNVLKNEPLREKLPEGVEPNPLHFTWKTKEKGKRYIKTRMKCLRAGRFLLA